VTRGRAKGPSSDIDGREFELASSQLAKRLAVVEPVGARALENRDQALGGLVNDLSDLKDFFGANGRHWT
jgi:hypothetical protein